MKCAETFMEPNNCSISFWLESSVINKFGILLKTSQGVVTVLLHEENSVPLKECLTSFMPDKTKVFIL